jgi:hypothetical protein
MDAAAAAMAAKITGIEELHVWHSNRGHRRSSDTEIDRLANDLTRICDQLRVSSGESDSGRGGGGGGDLFYLWHFLAFDVLCSTWRGNNFETHTNININM